MFSTADLKILYEGRGSWSQSRMVGVMSSRDTGLLTAAPCEAACSGQLTSSGSRAPAAYRLVRRAHPRTSTHPQPGLGWVSNYMKCCFYCL